MIFLGDPDQCDLRNKNESCINKITHALKNNENVKIVEFNDNEIIRNPILKNILNDLKNT